MADLTSLLLATQDPAHRAAAELRIREVESQSVDQYFTALAQELANEGKPTIARQLSGLLLKNALAAKDPTRHAELKQRWANLPAPIRDAVKQATTSALITPEVDVGKAAAQVLAKIGAIEIPEGAWPGLVQLLLQHVTNEDARAKQIALITLGYLCEELVVLQEEGTVIADQITNNVLTAVAAGMQDATNLSVKLEATRAFYHAVVLAQKNFRNEHEQQFMMRVITDCCKTRESEAVQISAFECLVQIATEYYEYLLPYMDAVGPLTWETIESASEKVAIPAIEFWSTICDEELDILDAQAAGQAGQKRMLHVIQKALPLLTPLLTKTLTRQHSEEDDDTWNLAMAAGTCLGLVAQVVGDQCVDTVIQFVGANFENPDWKFREAALLAYGSVMEGPTSEKMAVLVQSSYQRLVAALSDPSVAVRDTLAWTLGRIAQFHPSIVPVKDLTPKLGQALRDVPRVAANVCWVIQVMAENMPNSAIPGQAPDTTPLSEFFPALAQALLEVTARQDASERNLRMSAYTALSTIVSHSGNDCLVYMEKLTEEMVTHLEHSFKAIDGECALQGYICGVLTALVQRLRERVVPAAERLMHEALKVFTAYQQVKGSAQALHEEALLLVAALANSVGPQFEMFMPHFAPHLKVGLENFEDVQVCLMSTGVVGDLCRALEVKVASYCSTILQILYSNLTNPKVDRKIKPAIMTCFGDIALAITGDFEQYLGPVVSMLQQASNTRLQDFGAVTEESVEYLNSLREGVLEAYSGIIHGLRDANKLQIFKEHVNNIVGFVNELCSDSTVTEAVMKAAVGVIGDLIFVFQQELMMHLQSSPFIPKLVEFASRSSDARVRQTGGWLQSLLQKYGQLA